MPREPKRNSGCYLEFDRYTFLCLPDPNDPGDPVTLEPTEDNDDVNNLFSTIVFRNLFLLIRADHYHLNLNDKKNIDRNLFSVVLYTYLFLTIPVNQCHPNLSETVDFI